METIYPMRLVVKMTGLSQHVIRVWERRYGALTPGRSPSNRRQFTAREVSRLSSLAKLTHFGHNISQLAPLSDQELLELEKVLPSSSSVKTEVTREGPYGVDEVVSICLKKISEWDGAGLESALNEAALVFTPQILIEQVVSPLLEEIGRRWEQGKLRVAHEHLASAVIRSFLGNLSAAYPGAIEGPVLIVATPAGQVHELGALLAAKTAASAGFKVLYLGANLPAEEIAAAVKQRQARLLALSILYPAEETNLAPELERLSRLLPPGFSWVCGGAASHLYRETLLSLGCRVLPDLSDFRRWLANWRKEK